MKSNIKLVVTECPVCKTLQQLKEGVVSVYCVNCKTWLQLKDNKLEKRDNNSN